LGQSTLQILPIDGLPGIKVVSMEDLGIETGSPGGSFGLERRMGHWFFQSPTGNIPVIPPAKLVSYDELAVPWTAVKDKVPEAVDVVTSPNKDMALIFTRTEILIFGITQGEMFSQPWQKIPLKKGEKLIMAEWATGRYVDIWKENFPR
jgi:hypothetical protein